MNIGPSGRLARLCDSARPQHARSTPVAPRTSRYIVPNPSWTTAPSLGTTEAGERLHPRRRSVPTYDALLFQTRGAPTYFGDAELTRYTELVSDVFSTTT
jgi:hypothetical protein